MHTERVSFKHKCVFFLGAGFSADAGIPAQKKLLQTYLSNYDTNKERREMILDFLADVYRFNYTKPRSIEDKKDRNIYPNLEDVFSLLDNAIVNSEYIGKFDPSELTNIRKHFVSGIMNTINQSVNDYRYIKEFAQLLTDKRIDSDVNDPFSIITTNWDIILLNRFREYHDTIIEKYSEGKSLSEISQSKNIDRKKIALIDYCIYTHALRDYENHVPSFKIKCMGYKNIKLLNLHGSPIWLICQKCKKIFSPPTYDKDKRYEKDALPVINNDQVPCPLCNKPKRTMFPILIMPTYLKIIQNVHLLDVWQNAAMELQEAGNIYFIGYSLPEADYLIRYLFVSNIKKTAKIFVSTQEDSVSKTKNNYRKLFGSRIRKKSLLVGDGREVVNGLCDQIKDGEIKCFQS
jgi:NAD-dependent SIR2 family protein deacetylase